MKYFIIISFFISTLSFGQDIDSIKVELIENGKVLKKLKNGNLNKIYVKINAINYENVLLFEKENDTIFIKNPEEPDVLIKMFFRNKMQINELWYKSVELSSFEYINFNIDDLPKNSRIGRQIRYGRIESYIGKTNIENVENLNISKSVQLFVRLERNSDLTDIDSVFNFIAEFFSKKDSLYRIYSTKYAEKYEPQLMAFFKTNENGTISKGIIWTEQENNEKGKYEIYENGKIIKFGFENLSDFQKTYESHFKNYKSQI